MFITNAPHTIETLLADIESFYDRCAKICCTRRTRRRYQVWHRLCVSCATPISTLFVPVVYILDMQELDCGPEWLAVPFCTQCEFVSLANARIRLQFKSEDYSSGRCGSCGMCWWWKKTQETKGLDSSWNPWCPSCGKDLKPPLVGDPAMYRHRVVNPQQVYL